MSASRGGISFVLCTGDAVKHGQTYDCWREWDRSRVMRDYMVAMIPGNKEYYRSEGRTRWHDRWFASARNNPENGAPGLAGTYWFLYGGVLFVGIDTHMEEPRIGDGYGAVAVSDANESSCGACLFSVSGEEMTMRYISPSGAIRDTVSARQRRR